MRARDSNEGLAIGTDSPARQEATVLVGNWAKEYPEAARDAVALLVLQNYIEEALDEAMKRCGGCGEEVF